MAILKKLYRGSRENVSAHIEKNRLNGRLIYLLRLNKTFYISRRTGLGRITFRVLYPNKYCSYTDVSEGEKSI